MKGTVFGIPAAGLFALLLLPAHAEPEGVAEGNFDNSISDNLLSRANKAEPNFSIPKIATGNSAIDFKRPSNISATIFQDLQPSNNIYPHRSHVEKSISAQAIQQKTGSI